MSEPLSPEPSPNFTGIIRSVVVLVRDEDGRVLLASTSKNGPWSCIGGGVNDDEDLVSAATRLAREDCGLSVEVGELLTELSGDKFRVLYECGADVTYQAVVLSASLFAEGEQAPMLTRWFAPTELADLYLDEFARAALEDLHLR
ncbi:MAG TPA: NUDIX domain-containing protein [Acidimicrobiales bacterium]|nr:NUDIX domain-containing protein [Acidimicrobiales bacterium]